MFPTHGRREEEHQDVTNQNVDHQGFDKHLSCLLEAIENKLQQEQKLLSQNGVLIGKATYQS